MENTAESLNLGLKLIRDLAERDNAPEIKDAAKKADVLFSEYQTAMTEGRQAEAEVKAKQLANIVAASKDILAQRRSNRIQLGLEKFRSVFGAFVLLLVFGLLAYFLLQYTTQVGFEKLATIDGTRPLLVIAAIVSTITFGGSLLIGAMFSTDGTYEDRFRHAREIFLVFSGIFGTVIGFYFGAADTNAKTDQPSVSIKLSDAILLAHVSGGMPPYKVALTYGDKPCIKSYETKDGWAPFSLDKNQDNILGAHISVIDARGIQNDTTLPSTRDDLNKNGWKLPPDGTCAGSVPTENKPPEIKKSQSGKESLT